MELVQEYQTSPNNDGLQHGLARLQKVNQISGEQTVQVPPSKEARRKSRSKERRGKSGERLTSNERKLPKQEAKFKKGLGRLRKAF